jgi:uncharacterized protein (DUF302 family)
MLCWNQERLTFHAIILAGSLIYNLKRKAMEYYFSKTVHGTYDELVSRTIEALKTEGFGVISEINIHEKLKEKIGVDFKRYKILGACNPPFAYKALQAEDKIGTMLPCNVLVIEQNSGTIEIVSVNPLASMMAVQNPALADVAMEITDRLKRVISKI